jgi:hypothetical protein
MIIFLKCGCICNSWLGVYAVFLFTPHHSNVVWSKREKDPDCSDMAFLDCLILPLSQCVPSVLCMGWVGS